MKKTKLMMLVGAMCCILTTNAQVKVDFSKNSSTAKSGQAGFFAPSDYYLNIGYDQQLHRLVHADGYQRDDYRLRGVILTSGMRGPLSKKGIISLDMPITIRFGWYSDSHQSGYEYIRRYETGMQLGFMLGMGYRFAKKCYFTLSVGPKIDFTIGDIKSTKKTTGEKQWIDYISSEDGYKYTSMFDFPLSVQVAFRYQWIGIYASADHGMLNRKRNTFYEQTGHSKEYSVKSDRFNFGLQFYL